MNRKLTTTKDGSHSLYIPEMDEQYHSMHGSIAEALLVYIANGLLEKAKSQSSIKVFEMGFGTGLNAMLSWMHSRKKALKVDYLCLEKYPLEEEEWQSLNFAAESGFDQGRFEALHQANWEEWIEMGQFFKLKKIKEDLRTVELPSDVDLIYFDAFAPEKQPHLWEKEVFEKMYACLKPGGILTTYCVKGEIRRRLKEIGFEIEKLAGPVGGKREVLRARKNE
jgi:tRNA U34 5-methylaminomethyl-2-thiouridine-forming methyltransferase MnmC